MVLEAFRAIRSVKTFLSDRTQVVSVNGFRSHPQPVLFGVPQGTIVAPVLLLLHINNFSENMKSKIRLFADDACYHL